MLQCNFKFFTTPKYGNAVEENEDNRLIPGNTDEPILKFAISDGATETSFSKEWSDLLVSYYKDHSFEQEYFINTLKKVSKSWYSKANTVDLPWYAQQKTEMGAFAAFLGITVNRQESIFNSVAIGDCTLFQIRNNELKHSFPILKAEEYGNTPHLLSSNSKYQNGIAAKMEYFNGEIFPDDIIILATDALASWLLKGAETGDKPWDTLQGLSCLEDHETEFENWLNKKRQEGEIKNDDVTLIIINFE